MGGPSRVPRRPRPARSDALRYLDFDALDVVEEALRAYRGTLVMVTHDVYFAERVGFTRRWRVGAGAVTEIDPAGEPGR
jgi:ATPase subunit of ABC transporter with duplicated ATPase domains